MKNIILSTLSLLKIPTLLHVLNGEQNLTIISYRGIIEWPLPLSDWSFLDVTLFEEQIKYIKKHFNIISMSNAVTLLKDKKITKPLAAITFDDGYYSNYSLAYPILKDLKVPATIYLSTKFINTDKTFWFHRINNAAGLTSVPYLDWENERFFFRNQKERIRSSYQIRDILNQMPIPEIDEKVNEITRRLNVVIYFKNSPYHMLTNDRIVEMALSGLIEFGTNSHSHHILTKLTVDRQRIEIEKSRDIVANITGYPCKHFAYPGGKIDDYDQNSIKILEDIGIESSVTTIKGANYSNSLPMELRRIGIGANDTMSVFKAKVHRLT